MVAEVALPNPPGGRSAAMARYVPPKGSGAPSPLAPPRMIASIGLWRDLSAIWEVRAEHLPARGRWSSSRSSTRSPASSSAAATSARASSARSATDWRLVVARQDDAAMDPVPDVRLPGVRPGRRPGPGDEEFATRLMSAFQSFVGLVNLGAAQTQGPAPDARLGDVRRGRRSRPSKFIAPKPKPGDAKEPVDRRLNFSPSAARVGDRFVLSSTHRPGPRPRQGRQESAATAARGRSSIVADGDELARLVDQNRALLVMQDMLEKGHDKATERGRDRHLAALIRYLHSAASSRPSTATTGLTFRLEVAPDSLTIDDRTRATLTDATPQTFFGTRTAPGPRSSRPPADPWDRARVAHLHRRAGFRAPWASSSATSRTARPRASIGSSTASRRAVDGQAAADFDGLLDQMAAALGNGGARPGSRASGSTG